MQWYRRDIALGAGLQVGAWKYRLQNCLLGVYLVSALPLVILGSGWQRWVALSSVAVAHYLTGVCLWRRW